MILAAVLAMAPVAGIPPNKAEAILPAPCATSSILELCFELTIPSATTQDKSDSTAARIAMVMASGSTERVFEKSIPAKSTLGKPAGIV